MKKIRETVAKVTSVTYDEANDCYKANIDATVPVPTWTGSKSVYQEHHCVYLNFGTIDLSGISAGDTITIITYEHLCGETIKFYGNEEFTFLSDGCHNVITAVTKGYKTELGKVLSKLNYKDTTVKQFDSLAFHLYCIPLSEREELLQALVWAVHANGITIEDWVKTKFNDLYSK